MKKISCLIALSMLLSASSWAVPITVFFDDVDLEVPVGRSFSVDVLADIPDPVLGFGLDLDFDGAVLDLVAATFGASWTPVPPPGPPLSDGAGFGALLTPTFPPPPPPGGVSGDGLLLFTLTFDALTTGSTSLSLGFTPGDFTEGFTLAAGGFADVAFEDATVTAVPVPLPSTWWLLLGGFASGTLFRRATRVGTRHGVGKPSNARRSSRYSAAFSGLDQAS